MPKSKLKNFSHKKDSSGGIPQWAPIAVLVFSGFLYLRALHNDFVTLDDNDYILENPLIKNFSLKGVWDIFSTFYASNYHPFTTLTNLLEYQWQGLNPFPYHLVNVLLHLLNTWLVFKLAEQLSGKKITAIIVSLLFAVHPMHVESVAWISERKDVLYTFFYLLSLLAYLRYLSSGYKAKENFGAILLFLCSLFSKSAAVTLPLILIAIDFYKGRKINLKSLLEKAPFFILSLLFGILALLSQKVEVSSKDFFLSFNLIERVFLFSYSIVFYIVKLVIPFRLSVWHYYPDTHGDHLYWQYYAALPLLLTLAWFVLKRNSFQKEIVFGFFFFIIAISVMLPITPVGFALTAERYTYVSSIGLFYIAGQWISGVGEKRMKKAVYIIFSLYVIVLSYQTWVRIGVWKDGEVLFSDVIKKNPNVAHCYWMRANVRSAKGNVQGALEDMNSSIKLNPTIAETYSNRGMVHSELGDHKSAMSDYNKAIQLDPELLEAYNNRGNEYYESGETELAMQDFNKAIAMDPKNSKAYNNRSVLKIKTGDIDGAMKDINVAITLNHENAKTYTTRGLIKGMQKDIAGAIEDFNISIKLNPKYAEAFYNRGIALYKQNDKVSACDDWTKAAELGHKAAMQFVRQYCN